MSESDSEKTILKKNRKQARVSIIVILAILALFLILMLPRVNNAFSKSDSAQKATDICGSYEVVHLKKYTSSDSEWIQMRYPPDNCPDLLVLQCVGRRHDTLACFPATEEQTENYEKYREKK